MFTVIVITFTINSIANIVNMIFGTTIDVT